MLSKSLEKIPPVNTLIDLVEIAIEVRVKYLDTTIQALWLCALHRKKMKALRPL